MSSRPTAPWEDLEAQGLVFLEPPKIYVCLLHFISFMFYNCPKGK